MNRVWFVFIGDHHLGPFNARDVETLLNNGKINWETLLWREGMQDWAPLQSIEDSVFSRIPQFSEEDIELPPVPEEDPPPFFIPVESLEEKVDSQTFTPIDLDEKVEVAIGVNQETLAKGPLAMKFIFMAMASIAFVIGLYFLWGRGDEIQPFQNVRVKDHLVLNEVARKSGPSEMAFALTRSGDGIWAAYNRPGEYDLFVKLTSIGGQTLGERQIVLTSTTPLFHRGAKLKEFKFSEGEKIIPGRYKIEAKIVPTGPTGHLAHWLKQKDFMAWTSWVKDHSEIFDFQSEILLYSGEEDFSEALSNYKKQQKANEVGPIQDRLQHFKTYLELLNKLEAMYNDTVKEIWRGSDIKKFEQRYAIEVGPMLQNMIVTVSTELKELDQNRQASRLHQSLLETGKKIGELAAQMVSETEKVSWLKTETRNALTKMIGDKVKVIRAEITNSVNEAEKELNKVN